MKLCGLFPSKIYTNEFLKDVFKNVGGGTLYFCDLCVKKNYKFSGK